jgi:hypothetical protein
MPAFLPARGESTKEIKTIFPHFAELNFLPA